MTEKFEVALFDIQYAKNTAFTKAIPNTKSKSRRKQNRRLFGAPVKFADWSLSPFGSRARIQDGDCPPILRPARDIITHGDRTFLAVGDGAHPA